MRANCCSVSAAPCNLLGESERVSAISVIFKINSDIQTWVLPLDHHVDVVTWWTQHDGATLLIIVLTAHNNHESLLLCYFSGFVLSHCKPRSQAVIIIIVHSIVIIIVHCIVL